MTSVVSSSSINSAFISTTDHLPCDIIRSIWVVQSLNINIHKARNRLNQLLLGLQNQSISSSNKDEVAQEIVQIKKEVLQYHHEAILESQALKNQLITHKLGLNEEVEQLEQIIEHNRNSQDHSNKSISQQELRKQLEAHYKENPLVSQREAIEEQGLLRSQQSQEVKAGGHRKKARNTGLKLVFKVPQAKVVPNGKISKLKSKQKPARKIKQPVPVKEEVQEEQEDTNAYCFCKQGSFGDMIACDNEDSCPNGEWFHYKCVGLLNRVEALKFTTGKQKWFCSEHCRNVVEATLAKKKKKRGR
ncbi:uncharacterized protein CANTADRAFT_36245, partial [Suhomyces tanzawaensis NRRL Y-17324]